MQYLKPLLSLNHRSASFWVATHIILLCTAASIALAHDGQIHLVSVSWINGILLFLASSDFYEMIKLASTVALMVLPLAVLFLWKGNLKVGMYLRDTVDFIIELVLSSALICMACILLTSPESVRETIRGTWLLVNHDSGSVPFLLINMLAIAGDGSVLLQSE